MVALVTCKTKMIPKILLLLSLIIFPTPALGIEVIEKYREIDKWVWPVNGVVTDHYGARSGNHFGVDIAASRGEPVYAAYKGKVIKSYYSSTYGHVIFIEHERGYETVYAHLNKRLVEEETLISTGQIIGKIGNTGNSRGYHLHFEVHKGGWNILKSNSINPLLLYKNNHQLIANDKHELPSDEPIFDLATMSLVTIHDDNFETEYVVKAGDTLWRIANDFGISVSLLQEWNHLKSDLIVIGQKLKLFPNKNEVYVVQHGDTIESIAKQHGITMTDLKKYNIRIEEQIHPDQMLIIRK
jgi:murein DD-endopeptidase MepM/ murein hydrolase activator NlpD